MRDRNTYSLYVIPFSLRISEKTSIAGLDYIPCFKDSLQLCQKSSLRKISFSMIMWIDIIFSVISYDRNNIIFCEKSQKFPENNTFNFCNLIFPYYRFVTFFLNDWIFINLLIFPGNINIGNIKHDYWYANYLKAHTYIISIVCYNSSTSSSFSDNPFVRCLFIQHKVYVSRWCLQLLFKPFIMNAEYQNRVCVLFSIVILKFIGLQNKL